AGVDDARHPLEHLRVLILARITELLREVTFPDQDCTDARYLLEDGVEALDPARVLHHQNHENLALRVERPDVGAVVIVLLRDAPVAHRLRRPIAADALRLVERLVLEPRIAAGCNRVVGLLHARNMRPHNAVGAEVERLLGMELGLLRAVRRYTYHRRYRWCHRAGLGDLPAVEHVLQAIAQRADMPRIVFHLIDDALVLRRRPRDRGLGVGLAERRERRLAGLQGFDHAIETR